MSRIKLIDNKRVKLSSFLEENIKNYKKISIATGYWDLEGMAELIDDLKEYENIRILIGQEPLIKPHYLKQVEKEFNFYSKDFPKTEISNDLETIINGETEEKLRKTARTIFELIQDGKMEVRILRKPRLHAKAYILGDENSTNAIGIIGSSNFTHAGLNNNLELNYLEDNVPLVVYQSQNENMPHTHLSWFNEIWNDEEVVDWTFEFKEMVADSPLGNLAFSPYEMYIKTLMEIFPDELLPPQKLDDSLEDVLYAFQNRNAGILINKLNKMGIAILADSVGLGKTITAGAVIDHYINQDKKNIQIIAPASLKQQWIDDLSSVLNLDKRAGDFNIVSQQDSNAIRKIIDYYNKEWRRSKEIDLFVIDESHNLRTGMGGTNYQTILELLKQHKNSHVLLLTATPINNTLLDISNQIQLASKGKLSSVSVPLKRPGSNQIDVVDFFEALNRIQGSLKKSTKENKEFDFEEVKSTIHDGLRHYLVRSTRQGVEAEGSLVDKDGNHRTFPTSYVESVDYTYKKESVNYAINKIKEKSSDIFEDINPLMLNINLISSITQQTSHPLDFIKEIDEDPSTLKTKFSIKNYDDAELSIFTDEVNDNLIESILKVIFTLGFSPYRTELYNHKYYDKTIDELRAFESKPRLGMQLTIHNILQVTWLKRIESSIYAFGKSVNNYKQRLNLFEKYLDMGYLITLSDLDMLENEYNQGADIESAFSDYEEYLKEHDEAVKEGREDEIKSKGIERIVANPKVYNINQLKKDLEREKKILRLLIELTDELSKPKHNTKMISLSKKMKELVKKEIHGEKIIVFSFFADTIDYLRENLTVLMKDEFPEFDIQSEFISGRTRNVDDIVGRFSPVSKKYDLKDGENELNFLFSTDILSEGQNLQDAGILINYDLHWNPVRMIQRNGRINRIGSKYNEVLIGNLKPSQDLEMYLRLVNRLQVKISTIKHTIGLDQGVLDNKDVNPIEFIEKYYNQGELPVESDNDLLAHIDEHILELRKFLHNNTPNNINRVKNIPLGKWGYLPSRNIKKNQVISLVSTQVVTSSDKTINDMYFIEIDAKEEYFATHINNATALDYIKTEESDDLRSIDTITYNRDLVRSRSRVEATRQAENIKSKFDLKPKMKEALIILQDHLTGTHDLIGIVENGIHDITDQRTFRKIYNKTNKEVRDHGSPGVSTIKEFAKFIKEIEEKQTETRRVDKAEGVLFYANKK